MIRRRGRRLRQRAEGRGPAGWTVRLRLTVLYGALFLVSGVVLFAITYVLSAHWLPSGAVYVNRTLKAPGSPIRRVLIAGGTAPALPGPIVGPSAPPGAPTFIRAVIGQFQVVVDTQRSGSLHDLLVDSGLALGIMVVVSSGLGWLMAGRALRPLRAMTGAARRLSEDNLHDRLPESGPRDELRELAATFNALLGRLEGAFESQRRFVANASHELRTPLTLERAIVEVALADPDADVASLRTTCERVLAIGAEQEALIEALITLARSQRGLDERRPLDLADAASNAVEAAADGAATRAVGLELDLQPVVVSGDALLVQRLVGNLVDNAVRHNYPGGSVRVGTARDNGRGVLTVSNTGPVVEPSEVERILQPFQRLSPPRVNHLEGLGLGLSIVQAIATAHGADLRVFARDPGGLEVAVGFPRPTEGART